MAAKRIQFVVWSLNQVNSGDNRKHGSALLETVLEHVKVRVHDLNPSLFLHMASGHGIKVLLPAEDLQNILYTILENAVEALAQKTDGQVHVKVTAAEDSVEIEVWDNGDEPIIEDLQKFTEPFYTTKLDKPGRGMGLALSAAIIRAIDGQLVYRRDGAWTVATMTVPGHDTKGL
jgi:C4-dicarboxylate-specific signal transduction histidine kinase